MANATDTRRRVFDFFEMPLSDSCTSWYVKLGSLRCALRHPYSFDVPWVRGGCTGTRWNLSVVQRAQTQDTS